MNNQTHENTDPGQVAEHTRALMAATADMAGEKIGEARKRLGAALESAKKAADRLREKAIVSAKATDEAVRSHPYQAIAIGVGVGAVIGFIVARQFSRRND
jgi:ElaB/YqjD/DUF883 family membrane-anchored ribosome-binding protein